MEPNLARKYPQLRADIDQSIQRVHAHMLHHVSMRQFV